MNEPKFTLDWTTGNAQTGVDVVRAGNATRVNSLGYVESVAADTQRIDWSSGSPALLVEPDARNYLQDNTFQNSVGATSGNNIWWRSPNINVTKNSVASPDGTNNAALVAATTNTSFQAIQYWTARSVAGIYTFSIYVKPNSTDTNCGIRLANSTAYTNRIGYVFSLVGNGSVGNVAVAGSGVTQAAAPTITAVVGGWYRITISADMASATSVSVVIFPGTQGAQTTNSQTCIWGAQLEDGSKATSLILTTNATGTRNADVATITGTNFSDWWQAGKGGVLVRARPGTVSGTRPWVQFDDGTTDNIIALRGVNTDPFLYVRDGGVDQANIDAGTIAANTDYSLTGWWATNDCKARLDSGAVVTDTSATIPTVTQARLGSDGTNYLNGHIASISYYDTFSGQIYTRRKNKVIFSVI